MTVYDTADAELAAFTEDPTRPPDPVPDPEPSPPAVSTRATSVLTSLAARRAEIAEEQILELAVPRWSDPTIHVSYRLLTHAELKKTVRRIESAKGPKRDDAEVVANVDALISACKGVVAVLDGARYSLRPGDEEGDPTLFDPDLAANLGLAEGCGARAVVRRLFYSDGDILAHAQRLIEWCGYTTDDVDDDLSGE